MKLALFVNPGSGGGTDPGDLAERLEHAGADVDVHRIFDVDDVSLDGADRLVVASGDGGVGCVAQRALRCGVPLAVIPSGTANDFARALEIPTQLDAAVRLAVDPEAKVQRSDLGEIDGRPFVNVASSGMSTTAARRAEKLKPRLGPGAYPVGAIAAGLTASKMDIQLRVDGEHVYAGPAWQVLIAATGRFGGGAVVTEVDLDDLQLDIAILASKTRLRLPLHARQMLKGDLTDLDDVVHLRGRAIEVTGSRGWNVDGELVEDTHTQAQVHVQGRVEVVVPA